MAKILKYNVKDPNTWEATSQRGEGRIRHIFGNEILGNDGY